MLGEPETPRSLLPDCPFVVLVLIACVFLVFVFYLYIEFASDDVSCKLIMQLFEVTTQGYDYFSLRIADIFSKFIDVAMCKIITAANCFSVLVLRLLLL